MFKIFLIVSLLLINDVARAYLDIYVPNLPNRVFSNVSLGLNTAYKQNGHQCSMARAEGQAGTAAGVTAEEGGLIKTIKAMGAHGDINAMTYTPNRRPHAETLRDAELQKLQLAFVVALGGHHLDGYNYGSAGSINGLGAVWDSWLEFFMKYSSNTTSLILLLDERDFLPSRQNYTTNKITYLDRIFVDNLGLHRVDCVLHGKSAPAYRQGREGAVAIGGIGGRSGVHNHSKSPNHNRPHGPKAHSNHHGPTSSVGEGGTGNGNVKDKACTNSLSLDMGYQVYYYYPTTTNTTTGTATGNSGSEPFIIFASVYSFPKPEWSNAPHSDPPQSEDTLDIHWRPFRLPKRFNTNYAYTKLTNWYSYHMLNLQLLGMYAM